MDGRSPARLKTSHCSIESSRETRLTSRLRARWSRRWSRGSETTPNLQLLTPKIRSALWRLGIGRWELTLSSSCWRVDDLPILLHIDDEPPAFRGFVQSACERADVRLAVVRPLARAVGVMDDHGQTGTRCRCRPFEHLEVAV